MNTTFTALKKLIVSIIIFLFLLAGYIYLFQLLNKDTFEVSQLSSQVSLLSEKTEEIEEIETTLEKKANHITSLNSFFVEREEVISFISYLESLGKRNGIQLTIASVGDQNIGSGDAVGELNVSLEMVGEYSTIVSIVKQLEESRYAILLDSFQVNKIDAFWRGVVVLRSPVITQGLNKIE